MEFEFAKATEVTKFTKERFDYGENYLRFFVTPDVNDYHILRILKGYDEDYEPDPDGIILEYNKIHKSRREKINTNKLEGIMREDFESGDQWGYKAFNSVDEAIEHIDGGYGFAYIEK